MDNYIKKIPKELGNLINLKELYIPKNQILINLKELGLSDNLKKVIPKELGNLINLEMKSIKYKQVVGISERFKKINNK